MVLDQIEAELEEARARVGASSGVGECWSSSAHPVYVSASFPQKISEDCPGG